MTSIDKLPKSIEIQLTEQPLFHSVSDLMKDGQFGEQWLVLTEKEISVWGTDGKLVSKLLVSNITDARVVGGVGGGSLLVDTQEGPIIIIRYTASLTSIFGFASKLIGAVAKGEERPTASEKEFPRNCPKCRNPLPEDSQACPVCKSNGKVLFRMLSYAKPYKIQMIAAAIMLIFTTLVELVPPFLTKMIVDNVLTEKDKGSTLLWIVIGLAATSLVITLMQTVRGLIGVWIGSKIMGDLRHDVYHSLMKLSLSFSTEDNLRNLLDG